MPDRSEEIALLAEIRDLLRSIEERTARAEAGAVRVIPAARSLFERIAQNPRVRKLIQ